MREKHDVLPWRNPAPSIIVREGRKERVAETEAVPMREETSEMVSHTRSRSNGKAEHRNQNRDSDSLSHLPEIIDVWMSKKHSWFTAHL